MSNDVKKAANDAVTKAAKALGLKLDPDVLTKKDVDVINLGDKIILPEGMSFDEAITWIVRRKVEETTESIVRFKFDSFVIDGAVAFARILAKEYGWTNLVPTPGFWGDNPPQMIGVPIGYGEVVQVPWGRVQIPGVEGFLETNYIMDRKRPVFELVGVVQRKHEKAIAALAEKIREELRTNSIYRGRAVRMNFRDSDGDRMEWNPRTDHPIFSDPGLQPQHMDLTKVKVDDAIYPKDVERQINVNIFHPVRHSAQCRTHGVPLKRGVLLEGPYGTGKTLTAYVLAKTCEANSWTFLYLSDVRDLDLAITFARMYQPCVVFAEDVDKASKGGRTSGMDQLLNTLDGVDSKDSEVMVVLTTNEVTDIHQAFLRPGRIDAVVSIRPPDTDATVRMVRRYGRNRIDASTSDEALGAAVQPLLGQNAAFVREAVERAKLSAIAHSTDDNLVITADDIAAAAQSMADQVNLHNKDKAVVHNPAEAFVDYMADRVVHVRANGSQ